MIVAIVAGLVAGALVALVAARLIVGHLSVRLDRHAAVGARELDLQRDAIGRQLDGMGSEMRRVTDLVNSMRTERAEQHGAILQGLDAAVRTTAELADTTQSLREALASPKARGQWGERMADDVLRLAGMIEGVSYRKQKAISGGTVPDFTFLLPRGLYLHMDVKFPVDNYLRHLEAGTEIERTRYRDAFVRDVRQRVRELAGRGYADAADSLGYQLLFIPNESVYAFICEHAPALGDEALRRKIVLCSPFTLFAVVGVVRQAVDNFLLERATGEILEAMAGFGMQWEKFSEQLDLVGRRLASAQSAYDDLAGPRRRQLQKRLEEIDHIKARRGMGADPPDPETVRPLPHVSNL
ncbi:MAG: DNA recombination protein RmuC [Acidimicrobiales bacterium]